MKCTGVPASTITPLSLASIRCELVRESAPIVAHLPHIVTLCLTFTAAPNWLTGMFAPLKAALSTYENDIQSLVDSYLCFAH